MQSKNLNGMHFFSPGKIIFFIVILYFAASAASASRNAWVAGQVKKIVRRSHMHDTIAAQKIAAPQKNTRTCAAYTPFKKVVRGLQLFWDFVKRMNLQAYPSRAQYYITHNLCSRTAEQTQNF